VNPTLVSQLSQASSPLLVALPLHAPIHLSEAATRRRMCARNRGPTGADRDGEESRCRRQVDKEEGTASSL